MTIYRVNIHITGTFETEEEAGQPSLFSEEKKGPSDAQIAYLTKNGVSLEMVQKMTGHEAWELIRDLKQGISPGSILDMTAKKVSLIKRGRGRPKKVAPKTFT